MKALGGGGSISPKTSGRLLPLAVLQDAVITPAPQLNIDIPDQTSICKVSAAVQANNSSIGNGTEAEEMERQETGKTPQKVK